MTAATLADPVTKVQRYFDAWRRRDARAVLATLAPAGTYEDPLTGGPIAGEAFAGYLQGLWAAFPDLDFHTGEIVPTGDRRVVGDWRMHGHNHGPFNGLPPTGRAVDLPGIDVVHVGDDGIVSVRGYFDSAVVPRQLGLDVVVQPSAIGPFAFGTSIVVRRPQPVLPGVLAFTELFAAGDAEVQAVRDTSRQLVIEQLANPAFLGFTGSVAGRRMTTVSAWRDAESMRAAMHAGTHAEAMRRFFGDGLAAGGHTAVYAPVGQGPHWRRCGACGAMARLDGPHGTCSACGAGVEALA